MAIPFAQYGDLEDRWRPLSEAEQARATALLDAASRRIRARKPSIDDEITAEKIDPDLVTDVVCAMVKRAMQGPVDMDGVKQAQETAGPFSQGVSFANPSGNLFLSKDEKRDLGIGQQVAFTVDLLAAESSSSDG